MSGPLVAVLDYGIGNLRSAQKALQHVGADAHLTADDDLIGRADAVVLPGVGNFGRCMEALRASGLDKHALDAANGGRPFLGICVGMQMLFDGSEEAPDQPGLGILPGMVRLLPDTVKRPQMQWNVLDVVQPSPLLTKLDGEWVYFVHSYAVVADEIGATCAATTTYGCDVAAVVARDNVSATQFHPEKSGSAGLRILENFVQQLQES